MNRVRSGNSLFALRKGPLFHDLITRVFASKETQENVCNVAGQGDEDYGGHEL